MRLRSIKFFFLIFVMFLFGLPNVVFAADKHGLSYRAIKCPISNYENAGQSGDDLYWSCFDDYVAGNLDTYMVSNGDNIDPGTVILLIIDYTLGSSSEVVAVNTFINYNSSYWTPIYDSTGALFSYYDDSLFPAPTRKNTGWVTEMSVKTAGTISLLSSDITNYLPLKSDIELGYTFLKLNDNVSAGQSVILSFGTEGAKMSNASAKSLEYTTSDMNLSVYGSQSQDASLKSLTVSNGSIDYPIDPIFIPGDVTNKVYSTVVPNNITSVNINATVNNEYANVLPGGIGTKSLNVGDNTFNVTVSSQLGNTETYQVHVYRLSNDASLSNLSLSNINLNKKNDYVYTASIPYSINKTTINAILNDSNAFTDIVDNNWNLINYGDKLNIKNIVVNAENCLDKYSSVIGNTCTNQTYTIEVNREAPSNNSYLSSLTVDGVNVPGFVKNQNSYVLNDVVTSKDKMVIDAVVEDTGKAKVISGTGTVSLKVGDNSFNIVVEAEDKTTTTYTVNVRRLSDNINLSDLKVTSNPQGTLSPTFSSSFYGTYSYSYDATVSSVTISASVEDTGNAMVSLADVSVNNTTGVSKLNTATETYGVNTTKVAITVTAENGNIKVYYVTLNRAKSSDNSLSSLTLTEKESGNIISLSPSFNSSTFKYTATVDGSVQDVLVDAVKSDTYANVVSISGNTDLDFGLNTVEIIVEAENGVRSSYIVNLTREEYDIATLDDLKVDGVSIPGFRKDVYEYTLDSVLFDKDSIDIEALKTNSYSNVSGDGNVKLNTGVNEVIVKVTAQNGIDSKQYKINIYREKNSDNSVHGLTILGNTPILNDDGTYSITLPNSVTTLTSSDVKVSYSEDATIKQDTSLDLSTKNVNEYKFTIKSEKGEEKEYVIHVTRTKSNDTSVIRVNVLADGKSYYCMMDGKTSCTISLPALTSSFELSTVIADEATISPVNGTSFNVTSSNMNIPLTVTAEDGTIGDFSVNIVRQKSSNNSLSSLTLTEKESGNIISLSPSFNSSTFKYTATVDGSVQDVLVDAVKSDTYANVVSISGNTDLDFGLNTVEIIVEAENGVRSSYIVNLTREEYDIATLDDLKVDGVSIPGFRKDVYEYTLDSVLFDKDSIDIEALKTNSYSNVSGDGNVKLNTGVNEVIVKVTAQNGIDSKQYKINIYREKNSDNSVHGLTILGNTPILNDDGTYSITLPNSVTTLTASDVKVSYSEDATIKQDTSLDLSTKKVNEYKFTIKSENGEEKEYVIYVTRTESNDSTVSKVTLTIGSDSSRYCIMDSNNSCIINVPVDTTKFSLSALIDEEAMISPINGTSYNMSASESSKSIQLTVTAEDGTTTIYTVNVERQKSSNNNLADLKIDGVTVIGFDPSKQVYDIAVDGDINDVIVSATVEDTGKSMIITDLSNPFNLDFDKRNQIDITVKAEDLSIKTYTVYITRNHRKDTTLKDLTINGVQIDGFIPDKTEYVLSDLPYNTHQLNVNAILNDDLASKNGDGLISLNTGENEIIITVTAHDTSVKKEYKIKVYRELNDDVGIKSISLAGNIASYNETSGNYEVTVLNSVNEVNQSNLIVEVNDAVTSYDKKATYVFNDKSLLTTSTNDVIIKVIAENKTEKEYKLVVTREKSKVATLDNITVSNGSFNPSFNKDNDYYEVTVPVDTTQFYVDAVKTDINSTITSGVGNYNMTESTKTIEIVVVSEDLSTTKKYTLKIVRTKSSINTLSDITVSSGSLSPQFKSDITSYTVNVAGDVNSIDIGAQLTDNRATIESGTGSHQLSVGNNKITIRVKSESGAYLDYTLNVVRDLKFDNNLTSLTVDGVSVPNFFQDTLEYTLDNVPYLKTSINIDAILSDTDASVSGIGFKDLKTGLNTFEVKVTAQNGDEKVYKINVTRELSDNAYLSRLSVDGHVLTPGFDKNVFLYELDVDYTKDTLDPSEVVVKTEDANATVSKQDSLVLSTTSDNYYKVIVTAEDGINTNTYVIKVNRPKSSDATLSSVNVVGATLSPSFDSAKYNYTITVPYDSNDFTIEGFANDSNTQVFGNGKYSVNDGVVNIITTAENGSTLTYNFTITQALSNDATLSNLSVSGYSLDKTFVSTVLDYSIGNIPYGTKQLKVNADSNNASSNIEYYVNGEKQDSNIVNIPLEIGSKTITVKVTAPDGVTTKSYEIDYTVVASNNAYLSSLKPSVGNIDFLKTTFYYEMTVDNSVTSISFDLVAEDSNAIITYNGDSSFATKKITINNLIVGNNNVSVSVTAQDGKTTKVYNFLVKRSNPAASSDANLSSLSVNGYSLDKKFSMNDLEYSIGKLPFSLNELTINATANMGSSTINYLVNGVKQKSNKVVIPKVDGDSSITVQVVAEDGITVKNYKIRFSKKASTNAYLKDIVVSEGILKFNPNTFSYIVDVDRTITSIDVTAIVDDSLSTLKMNNVKYSSPHTLTISPLSSGSNDVVISVTAENGDSLTYKVTINKEADPATTITSEIYGHDIVNDYIKTVKVGINGLDIKNQLDNENRYLEIWTADESRKVSDSETLCTGMVVKLMIDGVENDRKYIVIKGDTSGDGEIDLFDAVKILNHYLSRTLLTDAYQEAAYVNDDVDIDLFDSVMILNHYLGKISLH